MGAIGKRACEVVRKQASMNDTFISFELDCIGTNWNNFYKWETGAADPNASRLAKMLKLGYDINYILLGEDYVNN